MGKEGSTATLFPLCITKIALSFVRYTAAQTRVGESFSFFASFFLFSKEKKKSFSWIIPLSPTVTSPFSRGTYCCKRRKNNKTHLHKQHIECHITSTGKGNYRRLQAQADSEERAIPPDGFTEFSLGQCCRVRQSINGRTTVSLSKSHGSMWTSPPTKDRASPL